MEDEILLFHYFCAFYILDPKQSSARRHSSVFISMDIHSSSRKVTYIKIIDNLMNRKMRKRMYDIVPCMHFVQYRQMLQRE